ncbi:MAG: 4-hydroxy-3-methylbut-2-enyl diphosphate reductase, partial [Nanoarchaeota archaeon]
NSSNSKELYAKCKEIGVESHFIQVSEQINPKWFEGKEKIGVTAGASTPDYLIWEVVNKIKEMTSGKKEFVKLKI